MRIDNGFTLVEMVVVLIIVAVISVFAAPRFFDQNTFSEAGFYEQSRAAIRMAQKLSIASGCDIRVRFTAGTPGSYTIQRWATCTPANHTDPTQNIQTLSDSVFSATSPSGISVSGLDFYFDRIGRPREISAVNPPPLITNLADLDLNIASRSIQVHPLTGYIQ